MLVNLLVWVLVFCVLAYVLNWLCVKFAAPRPVFWLVGLVLLLILLFHVAEVAGVRLP